MLLSVPFRIHIWFRAHSKCAHSRQNSTTNPKPTVITTQAMRPDDFITLYPIDGARGKITGCSSATALVYSPEYVSREGHFWTEQGGGFIKQLERCLISCSTPLQICTGAADTMRWRPARPGVHLCLAQYTPPVRLQLKGLYKVIWKGKREVIQVYFSSSCYRWR